MIESRHQMKTVKYNSLLINTQSRDAFTLDRREKKKTVKMS